ncbi:MAG: DNA starvation/stationary phase protection protein, partial [Tannerella sp.]|nr:DNA starvation/stationary phase protection protein [Tannerella sp.]
MATKNFIGLDSAATEKNRACLNDLLANRQVYYTNLRGLHWDIKGDKFFELHALYEDYYNNEASAIDELAERIAMLGGHPENRFSEYLKIAEIKETHNVSDWAAGLNQLIETMKTLLTKYHKLLALANETDDSGT